MADNSSGIIPQGGLSSIIEQHLFMTPTQQQRLQKYQQQNSIAQALLAQGMQSVDTKDRMMGQIAYKVSPFEGLAKIAQALSGSYGMDKANEAYGHIWDSDNASESGSNGMVGALGNSGGTDGNSAGDPSLWKALAVAGRPGASEMYKMALQEKNSQVSDPLMHGIIGGVEGEYPVSQLRGANTGGIQPVTSAPLSSSNEQIPPPPMPNQAAGISINAPPPDAATAAVASTPAGMALTSPQGAPAQGKIVLTPQQQAELEVKTKGRVSQAETSGKNIADAEKAASTIDSRFENSQLILQQMRDLASQTSGGPSAHIMEPIHSALNDKTSGNNASFENLAANQLTTALAPIVQGVGGRIDLPLMKSIQAAENIQLTDSRKAKEAVIDNLSKMLEVQRQNAHNQVDNLSGQTPKPQISPFQVSPGATHIWTPKGIVPVGQ